MTSIVAYRKASDAWTCHRLHLPDSPDGAGGCTELCTLDGLTYVAIPDGVALPAQPPQIAASVAAATLDDALRERIKAESTHCQLIAQRVVERIRAVYPLDEELYFARISVGALLGTYTLRPGEAEALAHYQAVVEEAREWGRQQRAALGL